MRTHDRNPPLRRLITAEDVAARLALPRSTVYTLASSGKIPGVVRVAKRVRFNEAIIDAWIAAGGTRSTASSEMPK